MKRIVIMAMLLIAIKSQAQTELRPVAKVLPADNSCCAIINGSSQKGQVLISNGAGTAPSWGSIPTPAPPPPPAGPKSFSITGPFYSAGLPADKNQRQWVPFNNSTLTVTARTASNILISSSVVGGDSQKSFAGIAVGFVGCEITVKVDNTIYEYNVDNISLGLTKLVTGAMTSGSASFSNFSVQVPAGTHTITLMARNDGYNETIKRLGAVYLTALVVPVN
jgi:hypothetical protein